MTRVIAGPFNRVEGDLEVALDIQDGVIARAEVTTTLYRGFEAILAGPAIGCTGDRAAHLCGICSCRSRLRRPRRCAISPAAGPRRNGYLAANLAHARRNVSDH